MKPVRKTGRVAAAIAAACVVGGAARGEMPLERMFSTVEVAPGVLAFVAPENNTGIPSGNVVAVIGDDGVLVIDSGRFPTLARRMIAEIRKRTEKPVRFLVHTHWHLDHVVGDEEFQKAFPGAVFVATEFTRRKMLEKQPGYLEGVGKRDAEIADRIEAAVKRGTFRDGTVIGEREKRFMAAQARDVRLEGEELEGAKIIAAGLTFEKELTVRLGEREVRIAFLGSGNTAGDTIVHVPDAKVVVTGDLLVFPTPYGYGCHPSAWIETLDRLMAIEASAIVPGHGPVQKDWDYAKKVRSLLVALRAEVSKAVAEGATLEETRERVTLESFRKGFAGEDWERGQAFTDFFVASAVERAYQEAKGEVAEE
jgi:glyoxylase-like metal-dependent hydrolase (beta-lactamase superfamily II)